MWFFYRDVKGMVTNGVFYRQSTDDENHFEVRHQDCSDGWAPTNVVLQTFRANINIGRIERCGDPDLSKPKQDATLFYFKDTPSLAGSNMHYYRQSGEDKSFIETRPVKGSGSWRKAHGNFETFDYLVTSGEIEPCDNPDVAVFPVEPSRLEDVRGEGLLYLVSNRTDMPSSALAWVVELGARIAWRCTDEGDRKVWEWSNYLGLCELWVSRHVRQATSSEIAALPAFERPNIDSQIKEALPLPYEWTEVHYGAFLAVACGFHAFVTLDKNGDWHTLVLNGQSIEINAVSKSEKMAKFIFNTLCMGQLK